MFVQRIAEREIIVVFQAHAAENDDIDFRLHGNPGKQFVVRFAGNREDRQLLGFDKRVEHVDHRDSRTDHLAGNDALRRIHGGTADVDHIVADRRTGVTGTTRSGEDSAQQIFGGGNTHRVSEETHLVARADAARSGEDLKKHLVVLKTDHLRERGSARACNLRKVVVADVVRFDRNDVAGDLNDFMIYLTHFPSFR